MPAGKGRGANAPRRLEPRNALKLEPPNTRTTRITKPSERTSSHGTRGIEPRNTRTTRITKPSERTSSRGTRGKSSHGIRGRHGITKPSERISSHGTHGKSSRGIRGRHGSPNPLSGHPATERAENRAAEYADDTDHQNPFESVYSVLSVASSPRTRCSPWLTIPWHAARRTDAATECADDTDPKPLSPCTPCCPWPALLRVLRVVRGLLFSVYSVLSVAR